MQHSNAKSLSKLIQKEFSTSNSPLTQTVNSPNQVPEVATAAEKVVNGKSHKHGAVAVFAAFLCILILAIQAVMIVACAIVQAAIHLKNLFGCYNPDYDIVGQLQDMAIAK